MDFFQQNLWEEVMMVKIHVKMSNAEYPSQCTYGPNLLNPAPTPAAHHPVMKHQSPLRHAQNNGLPAPSLDANSSKSMDGCCSGKMLRLMQVLVQHAHRSFIFPIFYVEEPGEKRDRQLTILDSF